ncbi:MAG TPA: glycogen-binding domain-containing protein, partial [Gemmatimonadales bacterium]|nr:glycogen-binding domain-containing protein [Gemmatimonadales bacterium]
VGATRVEVMGDFTGWQPVALEPDGGGRYRYALDVGTGLYRFNVRLDGGSWGVPEGIAAVADEFGGSVGLLAVP